MKRKLLLILFLGILFASCDYFASNSDGVIIVTLTGINERNFPSITEDTVIYLKAYETYSGGILYQFVAGTRIDDAGLNGGTESIAAYVGDPPHIFTYGETYYLDIWIDFDLDGDGNPDTGDIFWLDEYLVITINGETPVWVTHSSFSIR